MVQNVEPCSRDCQGGPSASLLKWSVREILSTEGHFPLHGISGILQHLSQPSEE